MRFDVVTLFPELFEPFLKAGVTRRAYESGLVQVKLWSLRDFAEGNYRRVDDRPFGGGPGMVMMAEPLARCLAAVRAENPQAPVVLFGLKRVMYYGSPDQPLDFTTVANTAEFTAAAALDPTTPRYLRVAGEVATVRGLQRAATEATGEPFKLFRVGGVWVLGALTKATKALMPTSDEVFPPWQGMQYMHNMFTGLPKLAPLDNARYPSIRWTPVREVLATKK
jgi:hypothetical protein